MTDAELKLRQLLDQILGTPEPVPPMAELLARLETRLAVVRPDYLADLQPGLTAAEWQSAAARLGVPVPPAFEALYRWRNGQRDGDFRRFKLNWGWMDIEDVIGTKSMYDSMIGHDFEPGYWECGWVPFMHNGDGSRLCLDAVGTNGNPVGCLVEFWKAERDRPIVGQSLERWLFLFVKSLETDVWEMTENGFFRCVRFGYG